MTIIAQLLKQNCVSCYFGQRVVLNLLLFAKKMEATAAPRDYVSVSPNVGKNEKMDCKDMGQLPAVL